MEDFELYLASMQNECNCMIVWTFFGIALLWDWNENWPFPILWPLLNFPNLLVYWMQHFPVSSFRIGNSSTGIPSPPLALFVVMLPKPSWLHTPGCLTLGEWSHHHGYPGHEDLFCIVFLCSCHLFIITYASVRSMPFLSFIEPIFAWNVLSVSLVFLKRSQVFPILLFSSISSVINAKK